MENPSGLIWDLGEAVKGSWKGGNGVGDFLVPYGWELILDLGDFLIFAELGSTK